MKRSALCLCVFILSVSTAVYAGKDKSTAKIKFGDVKPEDFSNKVYSIDSSANAVVLADIGSTEFEGNTKGDFSLIFKRHKRIHLINKNAFDLATIEVLLYIQNYSYEEKLEGLEAVTYNIENGQVVATKLDKESIFKDKYDKNHMIKKFTFPNLKEGSIIEYKYKIVSPYYENLQPWEFQSNIPHLWSEYTVTIPQLFDYVLDKQNYLPFEIDTVSTSRESYNILDPSTSASGSSRTLNIQSNTVTAKWAMKDVPALKEESYITSLDNYVQRVGFQLRRIKYSDTYTKDVMGNWYQACERMMKAEYFGEPLTHGNNWLDDDLEKATAGTTNNLEKAQKIYAYIRDNFTCKTNNGKYLSSTLKKVHQDKSGTVADLNLLLVAAFKTQGFEAFPAMLSTRANGKASESFPLFDKFNYTICRVKVDDSYYMLDASNPKLGFGKLPLKVYNGTARVIDPSYPILVDLSADSLVEKKLTTVFISADGNKKLQGSFASNLGYFASLKLRENGGIGNGDDYLKELKKQYNMEVELSNASADSIKVLEMPTALRYEMKFDFNDEDVVYFNPLFGEAQKDNPFKSAERYYPVEMPYCTDETYVFNMEIPEGYKVEELPKSARVKLNEDDGMFEYLIGAAGNRIQLRCRLQIKKALFEPEDYQTLRDFYAYVVSKEAEQIVFKKNDGNAKN
ncbi:DUF3858 domain-containing protein [Foetidibacter luteolus]|uniref:DUF3858 domain-containing protein n=1 Tax=Foetidibacter luteolus TaxID=2608880 RepID=UPI001A9938A8|nr:DUF3858 domain-containing protein [Foetidibacter luteolus]